MEMGQSMLTVGERVRWYRLRRGMSQEVLAGLVGRGADWLGKVEAGRIPVDRLPVLAALASALSIRLGDLIAEDSLTPASTDVDETLATLRSALTDYRVMSPALAGPVVDPPPDLDILRSVVGQAWSAFQDSRYSRATRLVPEILASAHQAVRTHEGEQLLRAQGLLAMAYQSAAMVLTKLGAVDLAWIAADRGLAAAHQSDNAVILGSLYRSVSHCLLANGRYTAAVQLTTDAGDVLRPALPAADGDYVSVYGTLFLAGSMAAARFGDRGLTRDFLAEADTAASQLGHDANRVWTAFGPTNVAIHRVSTAMELGDVQIALDLGPRIDTSMLPIERRARHSLEVARALSARHRVEDALALVLDAEELAREQVHTHFMSRDLVTSWVRTWKGKPPARLVDLTTRMKVA